MKRVLSVALLSLLALPLAQAQTVTNPAVAAMVCANNTVVPTPVAGQFFYVQCDSTGKLITSSTGGGLTPGTTVITGGTNTRVLFDDNGVLGESAGLTYIKASGLLNSTAHAIGGAPIGGNALAVTGTSALAGQITNALGTITTSQPLTITETWNAAGVTFDAVLINATSTASASGSSFARFQIAGVDKASIDKNGAFRSPASGGSTGFIVGLGGSQFYEISNSNASIFAVTSLALESPIAKLASTALFGFTSGSASGTVDTTLCRLSAGNWQMGTTACNALGSLNLATLTASVLVNGAAFQVSGVAGVDCSVGTLNPVTAIVAKGIVTHC